MDQMISDGGLDLALMTPRNPFLILSIAKSSLPAWGDLLIGLWGILFFSVKLGWLFFFSLYFNVTLLFYKFLFIFYYNGLFSFLASSY